MPVVEKTGGGRVYIRPLDQRFEVGDQVDVDEEVAAYLTEERGDFEVIDGDEPGPLGADPADMIEAGECPWCSDYEGEGVAQHAASAHPDEWDAYKED